MRRKITRKTIGIIVAAIIGLCLHTMLTEKISQLIYLGALIIFITWIIVRGLKTAGISQMVVTYSLPVFPFIIKILSQSVLTEWIPDITNLLNSFLRKVGIFYKVQSETCITILLLVIFVVIVVICNRDKTAMKQLHGKEEIEFQEKNYYEKSLAFCQSLRQRIETINRETDWNESSFTPIEAEVEVNIKGKRKKKFDDLLKCLKNVKQRGTIYLVIGDPGAGKSVALRKLSLELLDEFEQTGKIPVYINLKKWNRNWSLNNLPSKKDLIAFIIESLYENGDYFTDKFLDKYFYKMLESGRWYFIFDSFDEMPCLMGSDDCQELIDKISELLYQFMTDVNKTGGIVASRPYKSPSECVGATVILKIQCFDDLRIRKMLQKNYCADAVTKNLFGNREDLVSLCRNPFYLSLLINYVEENEMQFPDNQMQLYRSFIQQRLEKCKGKAVIEGIELTELYDAAKKIASYMQQSLVYGLEFPIMELDNGNREQYWRKAIKVLEYAKICKVGGEKESVSFVHRRFQEFFLVEGIIDNKKVIEYEDYKDIVNNSKLRDALVLYCEITTDEKAKEIAGYCWNVIRNNVKQISNILHKESMELIHTLYFMIAAFRNRKEAIKDFEEEFFSFVEGGLDKQTDFIVKLALTNSIVLFDEEKLQSLILRVFQLNNRWLSDVIMQNCRIIKNLDYSIENQFLKYLAGMKPKIFWEKYSNINFSLSLSKIFSYVRKINFSLLLMDIYISGLFVIVGYKTLTNINNIISLGLKALKIVSVGNWKNFLIFSAGIHDIKVADYLLLALSTWIMMISTRHFIHILGKRSIVWAIASLLLVVIEGGEIEPPMVVLLFPFLIGYGNVFPHDLKHFILQKRKVREEQLIGVGRDMLRGLSFISFSAMVVIVGKYFSVFINILLLILVSASILISLLAAVNYLYDYIHDKKWIAKQPLLRNMSRETLVANLEALHLERSKICYIEGLIQNKLELRGDWPDGIRPSNENDRLEYCMAKLDCLKIETYNYLF